MPKLGTLLRTPLFLEGSATRIPLEDASVDVVVSFETIEHLAEHEEMLAEIRRVLRQDGVLLISSPNKAIYTDETGYQNPFHVKELYTDEFVELVGRTFPNVRRFAQKLVAGSVISSTGQTQPLSVLPKPEMTILWSGGAMTWFWLQQAIYHYCPTASSNLPDLRWILT